jgi:methyltransferase (TIGR00027 family)
MAGMSDSGEISNVADTALWVATFRGNEGHRADAAFHDPLAAMLAGTRGRKIAASMPRSAVVAWSMVVRTSAIDALIGEALRMGIDTVVNLGAGLDTRPYRLPLPAELRWVEVDFPQVIESKDAALQGHTPACRVERVGLDLLDRAARRELFAGLGSQTEHALVIAEGVIPYFANADAAALAGDILAVPSFRHWIMDFDNAGKRRMPRAWAKRLAAAPFLFQVENWFAFFERFDWYPQHVITSTEQSETINRPYPLAFPLGFIMRALPSSVRRKILNLSGAVLMRKRPARARISDG